MRTPRTSPRLVALALLGAAALTGCGGGSDTADDRDAATSPATTDPTPSEAPTTEAPYVDPASVTLTAPGTTLAYGQPAVLPYTDGAEADGIVEITVEGVTPADLTDVKKAAGGTELPAGVPYYVHSSATGVANSDTLVFTQPTIALDALLTDGSKPAELFASVPAGDCEGGSVPQGFGNGDTYEDCRIMFVPEGQQIAKVVFGPGREELAAYAMFGGAPVVWQ